MVSAIVYIFQTLLTWEGFHWYPFLGLYFCGCSFMCIHRESYVAPGALNGTTAVHRICSRNGRHLPLQFSPHGPSMCRTLGEQFREFPHSAQIIFWISLASLGEFDVTNTLTSPSPCKWTVNIVLLLCATGETILQFWLDRTLSNVLK